jgi:hypothetical protein
LRGLTDSQNRKAVLYPYRMAIDSIIAQIDSEIARLTQARTLLATLGPASTSLAATTVAKSSVKAGKKKKRVLSADARKRIADAQRKRWAAQKAKVKK